MSREMEQMNEQQGVERCGCTQVNGQQGTAKKVSPQ